MIYRVSHYQPTLGSHTAGCTTFHEERGLVVKDVVEALRHMKPGERIVIECPTEDEKE